MTLIIIVAFVLFALLFFFKIYEERLGESLTSRYKYKRKDFFLSRAEHHFYDALVSAVGNQYYIFAQVHLPTILEHKLKGQNWQGALAHVNRKSVDFVLCDKAYISPKLAIELDDRSHERLDRQERDNRVEQILREAGLPLLRVENRGDFNSQTLAERIKQVIG
ncbi:MAG: DUF2726 domain-containing protein [Patescibacteria group bacterium]